MRRECQRRLRKQPPGAARAENQNEQTGYQSEFIPVQEYSKDSEERSVVGLPLPPSQPFRGSTLFWHLNAIIQRSILLLLHAMKEPLMDGHRPHSSGAPCLSTSVERIPNKQNGAGPLFRTH